MTAPRRPNPLKKWWAKFLREPPKLRTAARVIAAATLVVVVGAGILFRLVDSKDYPDIWAGMWFSLQTVTTVGYGDVTPTGAAGKIVASLVMLEGTAFIAIVTAAITSTFVTRAAREQMATRDARTEESGIDARLDGLAQQLGQLQSMMQRLSEHHGDSPPQ